MLHTVTTGLCSVVPVPVGNCVGTWFVSFVLVRDSGSGSGSGSDVQSQFGGDAIMQLL